MSCTITKGRRLQCKNQKAGIKNVYFLNFGSYGFSITNGVLTSIGDISDPAFDLYKYEVKGASGLEETWNVSRENGTAFVSQVLTLQLPRLDAETQNELKLLVYGRPIAFVEDYNGNIKVAGALSGMEATGGMITTGQASGDLTGFTLEMTGEEVEGAPFVADALKSALLATVVNSYIGDTPSA
jgi:hypothetical protein